ncbi:MAG: hypothetical protein AAF628_34760 [Planctomycetota bacterium]
MNRTCLAALALTCSIPAQVPHSEGPFAGVGAALSLQRSAATPTVAFKDVGFATTRRTFRSPSPTRPDFSFTRFVAGCPPISIVDVDAMSIGLDEVWANDYGQVVLDPASSECPWNALVFSVSASTGGAGSVIAAERDRDPADPKAGAQADLFSYILDVSCVPTEIAGVTQRAQDASELGLTPGDNIDALDLNMRLYELDDVILNELTARASPSVREPTFYFSVTAASAGAIPTAWLLGRRRSGATIFATTWSATSRRWSCPRVFLGPGELGLTTSDDITALCVDELRDKLLFGARPSPCVRDPLMYFDYGRGIGPVPYTTSTNGTLASVAASAGVLPGGTIDAACDVDPGFYIDQLGRTRARSSSFGSPQPVAFTLWPRNLEFSVFRDVGPSMRAFLTGWPRGFEEPGVAALFLVAPFSPTSPATSLEPLIPTLPLLVVPRVLGGPCGGPTEINLPIPPPLLEPTALELVPLGASFAGSIFEWGTAFPISFALP